MYRKRKGKKKQGHREKREKEARSVMWSHSQRVSERELGAHHKGRARSVQRERERGGCIKFVVGERR